MWMRKTLEAASATAAVALAAEARGMVDDSTRAVESAMERFGQDLESASLRMTAALITLAACVLVSAVILGRQDG